MKIALLVTGFNSLTQAVYVWLEERGMEVAVIYAVAPEQMLEELQCFDPQLVLCPYLKRYIPSSIYERYPTYIVHPGKGDRRNALEHALQRPSQQWGVVILRANEHYDGGDIYASRAFDVRDTRKASLYRQEVVATVLGLLETFLRNVSNGRCEPQLMHPLHAFVTQGQRAIDWSGDDTDTIIQKIRHADSHPGVLDEILGIPCYLYGAWKEERFKGKPKELIAKRDGAVCMGTTDGAVWISHLKEKGKFKLPATYVLKERLIGVKEERLPLIFDGTYETFYEIGAQIKGEIGYLSFDFHNGAMSTAQCIRLKYAIDYLARQCKVLVLTGGEDFFSNGIHLNILEESQKQGEDGWANINAMNDLVGSVLYADEVVTVASFGKNAGAGGVFLGLACDYVAAREGVVLNPHYKTLGLTGSEYHTYTLPKRVGEARAQALLERCLPVSAHAAKAMGMVDAVFGNEGYESSLHSFAKACYDEDFLWEKQEYLETHKERIEAYKERELEVMHPEFWDPQSPFHALRYAFVHQVCPCKTPLRFAAGQDKKKINNKETECMNIA